MLDERSLALLDIINNACPESGYKIFDVGELTDGLSTKYAIDIDGVRECIKNLSSHEYISVKYEDEREICACPLSKGRLAFENRIDAEIDRARDKRKFFIYSFLGGAIGSFIAAALFALFRLIFGGAQC